MSCVARFLSLFVSVGIVPIISHAQTQTRTVVCRDVDGNIVPDSLCPVPKPDTTQPCPGGCTVPIGYTWTVGTRTCTNPTPITLVEGGSASATDTTAPTTGSATFSCSSGTITIGSATCSAGSSFHWTQIGTHLINTDGECAAWSGDFGCPSSRPCNATTVGSTCWTMCLGGGPDTMYRYRCDP